MIHKDTEAKNINHIMGRGVFATKDIPKGTITWVRCQLDQIIPRDYYDQLHDYQERVEEHAFILPNGDYLMCWDHAKLVNHSFLSNTMTTPMGFDIAVRDIKAGEEITCDYGLLNMEEEWMPHREMNDQGRKVVRPDDSIVYADYFDKTIADALESFYLASGLHGELLSYHHNADCSLELIESMMNISFPSVANLCYEKNRTPITII